MPYELLTEDLFVQLEPEFKKCKKEIMIISPYVTRNAAEKICAVVPPGINKKLVTRPPSMDYVVGASDPYAMLVFRDAGFVMKMLKKLHAKVYLLDNTLYIGSANCTEPGLQLKVDSPNNKETLIKVKAGARERENLLNEYWESAKSMPRITKSWVISMEED